MDGRAVADRGLCGERRDAPERDAEQLDQWRALIHLMVTPSSGQWRKGFRRTRWASRFALQKKSEVEGAAGAGRGPR